MKNHLVSVPSINTITEKANIGEHFINFLPFPDIYYAAFCNYPLCTLFFSLDSDSSFS